MVGCAGGRLCKLRGLGQRWKSLMRAPPRPPLQGGTRRRMWPGAQACLHLPSERAVRGTCHVGWGLLESEFGLHLGAVQRCCQRCPQALRIKECLRRSDGYAAGSPLSPPAAAPAAFHRSSSSCCCCRCCCLPRCRCWGAGWHPKAAALGWAAATGRRLGCGGASKGLGLGRGVCGGATKGRKSPRLKGLCLLWDS